MNNITMNKSSIFLLLFLSLFLSGCANTGQVSQINGAKVKVSDSQLGHSSKPSPVQPLPVATSSATSTDPLAIKYPTTYAANTFDNATTSEAKDLKRLSDVMGLYTTLIIYNSDHNKFPITKERIDLGGQALCFNQDSFVKAATTTGVIPGFARVPDAIPSVNCKGNSYVDLIAPNPPVDPNGICPPGDYTYLSVDGKDFSLKFCLEKGAQKGKIILGPGNHETTKSGIK
jgi:hypothetical protein